MRILLIVSEFPPNHNGGGGVVFESLAKKYQEQGHEVLVITGDYKKKNIFSFPKKTNENGIDVVRVAEFFTPISILNTVMPYPFWYNKSFKRIIKNFNPEFTHIHGYGLFMPAQLGRVCRKLKIDYTFTIHGAPVSPERMKNPIISLAYSFYHKFYGFPLLNGAKKLTAVSSFARDFDIFNAYKKDVVIVGNGIDPDEYKKVNFNIFEQKGIKNNKNTKIILSLGRIEWWKGFQEIIEIIPKMLDKGYDIHYFIGGRDNGYKKNLDSLAENLGISNRVHYLGFIEHDTKMSALENCDIFAVPSIDGETFGISAIEGRLFKKPVLTTFFGGLEDTLKHYDGAVSLKNFEHALEIKNVTDERIADFYWDKIVQKYLSE